MKYTIELKPKAVKDLKSIQLKDRKKILDRMDALEDDLSGNVKKLTNFTPEYRMRSGNWVHNKFFLTVINAFILSIKNAYQLDI